MQDQALIFTIVIGQLMALPVSEWFSRGNGFTKICDDVTVVDSDQCCQRMYSVPFFDIWFITPTMLPHLTNEHFRDRSTMPDPRRVRPVQSIQAHCQIRGIAQAQRWSATAGDHYCDLKCEDIRRPFFVEESPWPRSIRHLTPDERLRSKLKYTRNFRESIYLRLVCPKHWTAVADPAVRNRRWGYETYLRTVGLCVSPENTAAANERAIQARKDALDAILLDFDRWEAAQNGLSGVAILQDTVASGSSNPDRERAADTVAPQQQPEQLPLPMDVDFDTPEHLRWTAADVAASGFDPSETP